MKKLVLSLAALVLWTLPCAAAEDKPVVAAPAKKQWYEFVFFSPLTSGVVVCLLGGAILFRWQENKKAVAATLAAAKGLNLTSLKEYQDEATNILAPLWTVFDRLSRLQKEAPCISDNKLLVDYLSFVLDPYSRFRVDYTESFVVYTRRHCPDVAPVFDYISDDVCNTLIYFSSDHSTRQSPERIAAISEAISRFEINLKFIDDTISQLLTTRPAQTS